MSPAEEPPFQFPLAELPQKETLHLQRLFLPVLKLPGEEVLPASSPNRAPIERDALQQSLLLLIFQSPQ
jgi:hypothetical protein